jgi:hypothetical protein
MVARYVVGLRLGGESSLFRLAALVLAEIGWRKSMKLHVANGQLKPGGAFKLVALGYLIGAGAIFAPLFALVALIAVGSGAPTTLNGEVVNGGAALMVAAMPFIMLPVVLAMQAAMFGGLVVFGLWLYHKRRPIIIVDETAL